MYTLHITSENLSQSKIALTQQQVVSYLLLYILFFII